MSTPTAPGSPAWRRISDRAATVETWVAAALLAVLTLILLTQVFSRYVLDRPLGWTDELARFVFVWLVFIGSAALASENRHIAVTYFTDKLARSSQPWAVRLAALIVVVATGVTGWAAVSFVRAVSPLNAPATGISMGIVYAASAVGLLLIALQMLPYVITGESDEESIEEMLEAAT